MTTVHCPRCRDEVSVPAKASRSALVRCPLCTEEYLLSEAMADAPPTLIVIGGEEDEGELVGAGAAAAGAGLGYELAGGTGAVGGAGARMGVGTNMFDSSAPSGATVSPAKPMVRGVARPKRKEKSAIGEILKVLIGGVVGLSLGLIALWWIFGKDPLELGPKVSPYAPWLVPAQFAGKPKTAQSPAPEPDTTQPIDQGTPTAENSQRRALPPKNKKKKKAAEPELQATLDGDTSTFPEPSAPSAFDSPSIEPALDTSPTGPTIDLTTLPELPSLDSKTEPKMVPKTEPKAEPTATNPAPAPEPAPAVEVSLPSAEDFQKAAAASATALTKFNESAAESREVREQLLSELYTAASDMGRAISYLSPSDADLTEHVEIMKSFLAELSGASEKPSGIRFIKFVAARQFPARKHDEGIFVAGTVKDLKAAGSMFELTLDGGKGLETLPVISYNNPQDFCAVGDELLAIGRIIEAPQKNLQGYAGEHSRVVLLGYQVVAPKATPPAP